MTVTLLFLTLFILILLGMPIVFSIGISTVVAALYTGLDLIVLVQRMFAIFETFPLLAIFLFVLMGMVLANTGVTTVLVDFVESLLGRMPGGLGLVMVWSSTAFGALTGSAAGTVAAIGGIMIPEMKARGYSGRFACALSGSTGMLGQMIPPSITAIIYGVVMNVSIGDVFVALIIPGLILASAYSLVCLFISRRRGYRGIDKRYSHKDRFRLFLKAAPGLSIPIAVVGSIYGGIATPTEAGAVGAMAAIVLSGTIYRRKEQPLLSNYKNAFIQASITSSIVLLIIAASNAFSYFFSIEQIPQKMASGLMSISENPIILLILFNVLIIFLGMFLEGNAILIMLAPLMTALFVPLDIDLTMLGVLMVLNLQLGAITPPLGLNLYIACGVGKTPFEEVIGEILPFILAALAVLLIIIFFPIVVIH